MLNLNWQKAFLHKLSKEQLSKKKQHSQKTPAKKSISKITRIVKILLYPVTHPILRYVTAVVFSLLIIGTGLLLQQLPSPRRLTAKDNFAVSTLIYDRYGKLLYEIYADENRVPIKLEELPPHVLQATVSIEDKNFYKHWGFDLSGIIRAIRNNLLSTDVEGGSTITQQLVKNAFLTKEKTLQRKFKELVLAVLTEIMYSKKEILEMYLNYISYGGTAVGVEAAAHKYFDKNAKDLNLAEASLLAGLPQAPSRYSPFASDPQISRDRQAEVLRRMIEDGYISQLQAQEAQGTILTFALSETNIQAPHFVFYVRDLLYEKYGEEMVEKGGLRVHTTLDLDLQKAVQASVSAEVKQLARHRVSNGAALVTKPNTGEILAMVGSTDYFNSEIDGQVNIALRSRQPGSSIKPLMYATAFEEKKLNPGSILIDIPTCFDVPGQPQYCPKNYDGTFKGPVTIRRSLGNSLNIPAVKAISTIGVETFMDQATKMGITTWKDPANYGLSLTLGGGEVRMIDMAQAFGVLANQGVKVPLTPILKIEDYTGEVLAEINIEDRLGDLSTLMEFDQESAGDLRRVMNRAPAYLVSHIMQDNNARVEAFGPSSKLVIPGKIVSAKTGTTNDLKDNWTIGFTPQYLVVSWVGNNDNTPMNPYLVSGVTGAAPIWNDIMNFILQGQESVWPQKPSDVAQAMVCANGMPAQYANEECRLLNQEMYWEASYPSNSRVIEKEVWIKPETGLPPVYGEQAEGLVLERRTLYQDPVTELYCADCRRNLDETGKIQYERHVVNEQTTARIHND
ncbi:PBP1A family penicillin-binding protein [Patescibacteria group bacterium]|nr:PBP1A family penicillin-binding protein [Patescibacteria group bacterium]MBU1966958.1 PBP1A family penicillin-binding protein [Patescibacteria group bacterium]